MIWRATLVLSPFISIRHSQSIESRRWIQCILIYSIAYLWLMYLLLWLGDVSSIFNESLFDPTIAIVWLRVLEFSLFNWQFERNIFGRLFYFLSFSVRFDSKSVSSPIPRGGKFSLKACLREASIYFLFTKMDLADCILCSSPSYKCKDECPSIVKAWLLIYWLWSTLSENN